jgi:hypothetical protein
MLVRHKLYELNNLIYMTDITDAMTAIQIVKRSTALLLILIYMTV